MDPRNIRTDKFIHIPTAFELLVTYDKQVREGEVDPYIWQQDLHARFCRDLGEGEIIREAVLANNGAGKSQFLLAPCVVWLACQFDKALCVVTSSSAEQMEKQTERYIAALCRSMNEFHKQDFPDGIWHVVRRSIKNKVTGSHIDLFVTDEANKAEGRHPIRANGRFAFFCDEAKSIPEFIFGAIYRCNNCSHRLDISSPGEMHGEFYSNVTDDDPRSPWNVLKVDYTMCPHVNKIEAEEMIRKHGIDDPLVRSSLFAEFTSLDQSVVISRESLAENNRRWRDKSYADSTRNLFGSVRAGLDLAAGGDENVLSVWHGNIQIGLDHFVARDTGFTADHVISLIQKYPGLKAENIWADDGGVGRGILDNMASKGFDVNRVLFNGRPYDKTRYVNRGAEIWYNLKRYVEEGLVCFLDDDKQFSQLINRYFKLQIKIILERKAEARKNGHPSPDRADAACLAWAAYPFDDSDLVQGTAPKDDSEKPIKKVTALELERFLQTKVRERLLGDAEDEEEESFTYFRQRQVKKQYQRKELTII